MALLCLFLQAVQLPLVHQEDLVVQILLKALIHLLVLEAQSLLVVQLAQEVHFPQEHLALLVVHEYHPYQGVHHILVPQLDL